MKYLLKQKTLILELIYRKDSQKKGLRFGQFSDFLFMVAVVSIQMCFDIQRI